MVPFMLRLTEGVYISMTVTIILELKWVERCPLSDAFCLHTIAWEVSIANEPKLRNSIHTQRRRSESSAMYFSWLIYSDENASTCSQLRTLTWPGSASPLSYRGGTAFQRQHSGARSLCHKDSRHSLLPFVVWFTSRYNCIYRLLRSYYTHLRP